MFFLDLKMFILAARCSLCFPITATPTAPYIAIYLYHNKMVLNCTKRVQKCVKMFEYVWPFLVYCLDTGSDLFLINLFTYSVVQGIGQFFADRLFSHQINKKWSLSRQERKNTITILWYLYLWDLICMRLLTYWSLNA